jgi:hypothetical protein
MIFSPQTQKRESRILSPFVGSKESKNSWPKDFSTCNFANCSLVYFLAFFLPSYQSKIQVFILGVKIKAVQADSF